MRIAATYDDGQIFQHFGHAEHFKIYDVEGGQVKTTAMMNVNGSGHGALAGLLKNNDVDILICGGIGCGAKQALAQAGVRLHGGVAGDAERAVEDLQANNLTFNPGVKCNHHGHSCGEHSCG
ncbi:MAG: NifB/NifX family molybdenum-iron cluster-binding protein [Desulfobulbus sp.]|nr:NifB/NifX family molybdenum-iron cluster-binding protein [Desulfobulbus sp.]